MGIEARTAAMVPLRHSKAAPWLRPLGWYQKYLELGLRRKPLQSSKDGRHIVLRIHRQNPLVDERRGHGYISNSIRTSRYTLVDFLPKQLFFQFTRLANFYLLIVGVLQTVPGLSTTGNFTQILPLLLFVLLTILKEGYDDWKRRRLDRVENAREVTVLSHGGRMVGTRQRAWTRYWREKAVPPCGREDADVAGGWMTLPWKDVEVGDVIRLSRDEDVPADMVLLHADGGSGLAYVDTMALDGESNLKIKQVSSALRDCDTVEKISRCHADFVVEDPNPDLYRFDGRVTVNGKTAPLTASEVVYRGSTLRNTRQVIGLVINTGEECKVRRNANRHPTAKKPALEKIANRIVLTLVVYVVVLAVGCWVGYIIWQTQYEEEAGYLDHLAVPFHDILAGFAIQYNNLVPLALYVSLELVKLGQMRRLNGDGAMYDDVSDTPARCNTNTILENLGQIGYILTDKTGTLTENVMKFRKMSIAGTCWLHTMDRLEEEATEKDELTTRDLLEYIHLKPHSAFTRRAQQYLLAMALCHTCLPEIKDGKVDFQAASPDEMAIVQAAQELGFLLMQRSMQTITLRIAEGDEHTERTYRILDVIEFSSKRQRMSIVVRCPDGKIWLISKGADSVIRPRLRMAHPATEMGDHVRGTQNKARWPSPSPGPAPHSSPASVTTSQHKFDFLDEASICEDGGILTRCFQHTDDFASQGLRTLLFAHRFLDEHEYSIWKKRYQDAETSLVNRQERMEEAGALIEDSLHILGATAIEDKLQDGVPDTIDRLRRAKIKIWMLTGDKRETAVNIAHSARICRAASDVHVLDVSNGNLEHLERQITDTMWKMKMQLVTRPHAPHSPHVPHAPHEPHLPSHTSHTVLVIDGHTLAAIDKPDAQKVKEAFCSLMTAAHSLICYRASPAQKALLVRTLRSLSASSLPAGAARRLFDTLRPSTGPLTLAIGDGANDLAMLSAAHVGVGISGKEGRQAARVADYSIGQFRFLSRLLLVHGRWNYMRTARFILATFWKEMFFYTPCIIYNRYNGFTGTSLYESWSLTALNGLFTGLAVIVPAIWEQDLAPDTLLAVPDLYVFGQRDGGLNMPKFMACMVTGAVEGVLVWLLCWVMYGGLSPVRDNGLFPLGNLVFSVNILWTNFKLLIIDTHHRTVLVVASCVVTVAGWWAWQVFLSGAYPPGLLYAVHGGFTTRFGEDATWWAALVAVLGVLATGELAVRIVRQHLARLGLSFWAFKWLRGDSWRRTLRAVRIDGSMPEGNSVVDDADEWDVGRWQALERKPGIRTLLAEMARTGNRGVGC